MGKAGIQEKGNIRQAGMSKRKQQEISERLKSLYGKAGMVVQGKVVSVNEPERTCEVEPTDDTLPTLQEVWIRPIVDSNAQGFYGLPSDSANVAVLMVDEDTAILLSSDAYDSIILRSNELGGLIKIEQLVGQLNALEQKVNSILNTLKTHVHPTPSGPSSPSTDFVSIQPLPESQREDLENENVQHG